MATLRFFVDWEPVAQPRQRHRIVGRGREAHVQNYLPTDHPVHSYKAAVRTAACKTLARRLLLTGPLMLELLFLMPRPQAMIWKMKPMPRVPHTGKPDADNLAKAFMDACNGLLWRDDSQICELHTAKYIAAGNERPGVIVELVAVREETRTFIEELHESRSNKI